MSSLFGGNSLLAKELLTEALQIRRASSGPSHPSVAIGLADLGEYHFKQGEYDKAAEMLESALDVVAATVGSDHLYGAPIVYHLGETRRMQGRHEEALALYNRSIAVVEKAYGPSHSRLSIVYRSAATSAAALKRKTEAKSFTQRAAAIERTQVDFTRHTVDVSAFIPRK